MSAHLNISKRRRFAIYHRDDRHCVWCGALCEPDQLTLDHVVPRSHGGTDATRNLVTACLSCNSRRGCQTLLAFARFMAARQCVSSGWIVVRVLSAAETPILIRPTKRSARKQRGQLSMVLQEGALR